MMSTDWWVKLRGKLFDGDDGRLNACVNFARDANRLNTGYVEGYRRGAVALFERILETDRDHNYLVYPIVFLWRQCIELQLKEIIALGSQVDGGPYEHPTKTHDVGELWQLARPI